MNIYIFSFLWRGEQDFSLFVRRYVKRKRGRRFVFQPSEQVRMIDNLTGYEVGQLLGGN